MNHSSNMHPADVDAMLHDVSNQMARSQLFRRLSANSNTSSPGSKKGTARVVKTHNSTGSPHGVQRRRTTAAHATRNKLQTAQSLATPQQLPQGAGPVRQRARQHGPPAAARPVTWHPGSYLLGNCPEELPYGASSTFNSFAAFQTPIFTDHSNYLPQSSSDSSFTFESLPPNTSLRCSSRPTTSDYNLGYNQDNVLCQSALSDYSTQFLYHCSTDLYNPDLFASAFQATDMSQVPSDYASYSIQHTPTLFSDQNNFSPPPYVRSPDPPHITKQKSKELVGMGLYDGPGRKELSTLNSSPDHIDQLFTVPQGKGLKLEETWQPPNENTDEVEEEGSSEDEAEEVPPPAPTQVDVQSTYIPAYGDLSNQSFFFDGDDPYYDCMPFDQGFQVCQPKASDPSFQNFMWF